MPILPARSPTGSSQLSVAGGENLFYIASRNLGDATQWWRISEINSWPGQPPDFIVVDSSVLPNPDTLLIPQFNPNATDP